MMMEPMYDRDPYDLLFGDEQQSLPNEGLMFTEEVMFTDFHNDSSSISPIANTAEENHFDATLFEDLVNQLISSDPTLLKETSFDLTFESDPPTREIGTDPMEPVSTVPIIIQTTHTNQPINKPIILIRTTTTPDSQAIPIEYSSMPTTMDDYPIEDILPLTPSSSSPDSHDEGISNSPEYLQNTNYTSMLTDLDNLPTSGSLVLTKEEIKIIKQEGYQVPTKLPLNKTEEKMLKKIRRKIKNKISAQESRRKKKEYVDALEKQIAQMVDENKTLKERMNQFEKNQKTLTKERDLLRSMIGKATTPAPSTALMVFAAFFAVLFGVWSPIVNKSSSDDRSLALIPSQNYQSVASAQKTFLEQQQQETTNSYKSRVLLSIDEYDNHHHGPYLPSNNKYKSTFQSETAAPGYTYSNTVEKYMNKKVSNEPSNTNLKRPMAFSDDQAYKKLRSNYRINEDVVFIEETTNDLENDINEIKPVKIIRVERTIPAIGNDTLKLAHRTIHE